jgi:hypothetical protein
LMTLSGLLTNRVDDFYWWGAVLKGNLLMCVSVAYAIHALFRLLELTLPAATIERITTAPSWRSWMLLNLLLIVGTILGSAIGLSLFGMVYHFDPWHGPAQNSGVQIKFLMFWAVMILANWIWWVIRQKRRALQHLVTQAQLRLLQAQIEPHFLFNTLANVQSLMDYDPPRAKQMLEVFTDYLRASLGQLRHADSALEAELEMAQNYLQLLQIRMEDRLTFKIQASAQARAAVLPTLLLQPLIENAIHHGLEPKIEGGHVHIRAEVLLDRLEICVDDDGLGLDAPRRSGRTDNGMALANIRERLQTSYGSNASLSLIPQTTGTRVIINLPYATKPTITL